MGVHHLVVKRDPLEIDPVVFRIRESNNRKLVNFCRATGYNRSQAINHMLSMVEWEMEGGER